MFARFSAKYYWTLKIHFWNKGQNSFYDITIIPKIAYHMLEIE